MTTRFTSPLSLNYSDQPINSRIAVAEVGDVFCLRIKPSGTWKELRSALIFWLIAALPSIPVVLAYRKLLQAFPELPYPWWPILFPFMGGALIHVVIAWIVGAYTVTIDVTKDELVVRTAGRFQKRCKVYERSSISGIRTEGFSTALCIFNTKGKRIGTILGSHRADRRWLATTLRSRLGLGLE